VKNDVTGAAVIRDATPQDFSAILALNDAAVHFTSAMDAARLQHLHAQAKYHRVAEHDGSVAAFLLAFREGAAYDSVNYQWFANSYSRFLYIDRIVVAPQARGLGLGIQLYEDIIAFAARTRAPRLTCEYDLDPPNPVSEKFHARFGFREVARQRAGASNKQVSLQMREIVDGTV
jgi:predicted GNAT superfamily acetyltransferase